MSLKSFDKFCEKMITAKPGSEKEIFDERQKIIRSRLTIEALLIYACITLINAIFMDAVYQWAERHFSAMLLIMNVCLFYWLIRCAAKGCIIAANGSNALKVSSIMIICISTLNLSRYVFDLADGVCLLKDGRLTDDLLFFISFFILIVDGIFCLFFICRENKKNNGTNSDDSSDESSYDNIDKISGDNSDESSDKNSYDISEKSIDENSNDNSDKNSYDISDDNIYEYINDD